MTQAEPLRRDADAGPSPLAQIEALASRVRAGDLTEEAALSRIATLVRDRPMGDIYQKPLG